MSKKKLKKNEKANNVKENPVVEELAPAESSAEEAELEVISSAEFLKTEEAEFSQPLADAELIRETAEESEETEEEIDPIFKELSEPKLPELPKDNRARLQMQSPTRAFLYWSFKNNPYQTLNRVFGNQTGSYTLVAKLTDLSNGIEELFPIETEGSWWFNVNAGSIYQAEIGFYAPNRPFVRIMFSNTLEMPRKSPSPRHASDADWAITAMEFAEVLDSSGYTQDAFEVALAGDDFEISEQATQNAFSQFIGETAENYNAFDLEEIRFALLALASGVLLEELRGQISEKLFAVLQENVERLSAENAYTSLQEYFEVMEDEIFEEEDEVIYGKAVFGASLINFPKSSKKRKRTVPKSRLRKLPEGGLPQFGRKISQVGASEFGGKISPISSFDLAK
jgi:hypothetical protein